MNNYRIKKVSGNNTFFYVERKIFNKWYSIYKSYISITIILTLIYNIIWIYLSFHISSAFILLILLNLLLIPIINYSIKDHKHLSISYAENYLKKIYKRKQKTKPTITYYKVVNNGAYIDTEEYDNQDIRKEKLLKLKS